MMAKIKQTRNGYTMVFVFYMGIIIAFWVLAVQYLCDCF